MEQEAKNPKVLEEVKVTFEENESKVSVIFKLYDDNTIDYNANTDEFHPENAKLSAMLCEVFMGAVIAGSAEEPDLDDDDALDAEDNKEVSE